MSAATGLRRYYRLQNEGLCAQCGERIPERGVRCDYCCLKRRYWAAGSWRTAMDKCPTKLAAKVLENEWKRLDQNVRRKYGNNASTRASNFSVKASAA